MRDREDAVVARLHQLAPHLDGEPDPAFRAAARARLVAMAAVRTPAPAPASGLRRLLAARAPDAPPARWRSRLTAGLAGAALTVTALASLVAVADGARPGDVLYDLKRGTEETQLALAGEARGRTLLDFATTRLDELETLVGDGGTALPALTPAGPADASVSAADADPGLVLETLQTMDAQTAEGTVWLTGRAVETSDSGPLDYLAEWATEQAARLAALQDLVPDAAADAVGRSLGLLAEIGARSDGLQAVLDCPAGPAVGGTDDLGPVPAACPAPEGTAPATVGGGTTPPGAGGTSGGGPAPEATTSGLPAVPPTTVPGTGGGFAGVPTPTPPTPTPTPTPTPGGPLIPSLPLPGGSRGTSPTPPSPIIAVPPVGPVSVCVGPLVTIGDCGPR